MQISIIAQSYYHRYIKTWSPLFGTAVGPSDSVLKGVYAVREENDMSIWRTLESRIPFYFLRMHSLHGI